MAGARPGPEPLHHQQEGVMHLILNVSSIIFLPLGIVVPLVLLLASLRIKSPWLVALVGGSLVAGSTGPVCLYLRARHLLGGAVTSSTWLLKLLTHSQTAARTLLSTASCAVSAVKLLADTGSNPETTNSVGLSLAILGLVGKFCCVTLLPQAQITLGSVMSSSWLEVLEMAELLVDLLSALLAGVHRLCGAVTIHPEGAPDTPHSRPVPALPGFALLLAGRVSLALLAVQPWPALLAQVCTVLQPAVCTAHLPRSGCPWSTACCCPPFTSRRSRPCGR